MKVTEISKIISTMWKELSESEQKKYKDKAAALKVQYNKDLKEWKERK